MVRQPNDNGKSSSNNDGSNNFKPMKLHKLLLVDPKKNSRMDKLAERLVSFRAVHEMVLTDHERGYLVKLRFFPGYEPKNVRSYLSDRISKEFGKVENG
ncbi:MAG: hypothetical protein M1504_01995 [Candidatus Marsarchaeota archaeon]|nr:hypothetical protein [Candidatus Marsarchaeota archaeon]